MERTRTAKEERQAAGRAVTIGIASFLIFLMAYHAWMRDRGVLTALIAPVVIMFMYIMWVYYTSQNDQRKRQILKETNSVMELNEIISHIPPKGKNNIQHVNTKIASGNQKNSPGLIQNLKRRSSQIFDRPKLKTTEIDLKVMKPHIHQTKNEIQIKNARQCSRKNYQFLNDRIICDQLCEYDDKVNKNLFSKIQHKNIIKDDFPNCTKIRKEINNEAGCSNFVEYHNKNVKNKFANDLSNETNSKKEICNDLVKIKNNVQKTEFSKKTKNIEIQSSNSDKFKNDIKNELFVHKNHQKNEKLENFKKRQHKNEIAKKDGTKLGRTYSIA